MQHYAKPFSTQNICGFSRKLWSCSPHLFITKYTTKSSLVVSDDKRILKFRTKTKTQRSPPNQSLRKSRLFYLHAHVQVLFILGTSWPQHIKHKHPIPTLQSCTAHDVACIRWSILNTGWCALALAARDQSLWECARGVLWYLTGWNFMHLVPNLGQTFHFR